MGNMDFDLKATQQAFESELKALLEKYGATLEVLYSDCSDTYGVSGEAMGYSLTLPKSPTAHWSGRSDVVKLCNGWGLDASDI